MSKAPVPKAKISKGPMKAGTLDIGMPNPAVNFAETAGMIAAKAMAKRAAKEVPIGYDLVKGTIYGPKTATHHAARLLAKVDPASRNFGVGKNEAIAKTVAGRVGGAISQAKKAKKAKPPPRAKTEEKYKS